MSKIMISLLAVALVAGSVGGSLFAAFSDTETSTGNTFTACILDLEVNEENPWDGPEMVYTAVEPCHNNDPIRLDFHPVNGPGHLYYTFSYTELDETYGIPAEERDLDSNFEFRSGNSPIHAGMEMTADEFARLVFVKKSYVETPAEGIIHGGPGPEELAPGVPATWLLYADANGDGLISLYELAHPSEKGVAPDDWWSYGPYDDPTAFETCEHVIVWLQFHLANCFEDGLGSPYCADISDPFNESDQAGMGGYSGDYDIHDISDDDPLTTSWNVPQADGIDMTITAELRQIMGP
jgi:predicted ribosomally synthesized peptide with SipW-like signal peptide